MQMRLIAFLGIDSYDEFLQNVLIPRAPILLLAVIVYFMYRTLKLMPRTKPQEISPRSKSSITWDDVAGVDETKDELREVVDFLTDPKRFKQLGARVPKGILLHGPPGTGKTLLAKAVAHESGANFFAQSAASFVETFVGGGAARIRRLSPPGTGNTLLARAVAHQSGATFFAQSAASFVETFVGVGAARIRRLFKVARKHAPAIVFIDELDAARTRRRRGGASGAPD